MKNLNFFNNAAMIAHLRSRVDTAQHYAVVMPSESKGFLKEAAYFQAELDKEVQKREELILTVTKDDIRDYVQEQQKMAKKYKTHAELINSHLEYYLNKL